MHLYIGGDLDTRLANQNVKINVTSDYPWNGAIGIKIRSAGHYRLGLRIPGWCRDWSLQINDNPINICLEKGYAYVEKDWAFGDEINLTLDMPAVLMRANPSVREDIGKVAVTRGPLVYCMEEADNGIDLHRIMLTNETKFETQWQPEFLNGVVTMHCMGKRLNVPGFEQNVLYAPARQALVTENISLMFIPYYAWANRGPGEMQVWVHEAVQC